MKTHYYFLKGIFVYVSLLVAASSGGITSQAAPAHKAMQLAVKNASLQRKLLRRGATDQAALNALFKWEQDHGIRGEIDRDLLSDADKRAYKAVRAHFDRIARTNATWLNTLVRNQGWPTISQVGRKGANAAWLLVQHADADPKLQRFCLDAMGHLPKREVSQVDSAYLTDRVLLAEGKKQRYGTQFTTVNGKRQPRPIEEEASVDKRRAALGLPSMAEYTKMMQEYYERDKKK